MIPNTGIQWEFLLLYRNSKLKVLSLTKLGLWKEGCIVKNIVKV